MWTKLEELATRRKQAAVNFENFIKELKEKYEIPLNIILDIDNASGEVHEHGDPENTFRSLTSEELKELLELPRDTDFDRWEQMIIAEGK